jgi:hypothetical protein
MQRRQTVHRTTVGTSYDLNSEGELSEGLWLMGCTCGWRGTSGFFHTAQHMIREHLGLPVDWDSREIEVPGLENGDD